MAKLNRIPLQVSPKFADKLKDLQRKIRMKTGNDRSLRDLTDDLVSSKIFEDIEQQILNQGMKIDFKIRFDRRLL
jgi:uncharacterized protein YihD (DUF1040 family)